MSRSRRALVRVEIDGWGWSWGRRRDASFMTLRTTAGSWMAQSGVSLHKIQKPSDTRRRRSPKPYHAYLDQGQLDEAVDALDARIRGTEMDTQEDTNDQPSGSRSDVDPRAHSARMA